MGRFRIGEESGAEAIVRYTPYSSRKYSYVKNGLHLVKHGSTSFSLMKYP